MKVKDDRLAAVDDITRGIQSRSHHTSGIFSTPSLKSFNCFLSVPGNLTAATPCMINDTLKTKVLSTKITNSCMWERLDSMSPDAGGRVKPTSLHTALFGSMYKGI